MALQPDFGVSNTTLSRLHAGAVSDGAVIRELFRVACTSRLVLSGRRTITGEAEQARIRAVEEDHLVVRTSGLEGSAGSRFLLRFGVDGRVFSFTTLAIDDLSQPAARISIPTILYVAERRDRNRLTSDGPSKWTVRVRSIESGWSSDAVVEDYSPVGLNVCLAGHPNVRLGETLEVRFENGDLAGTMRWGQIKHLKPMASPRNWTCAGMAISEARHTPPLAVERRERIADSSRWQRVRTGVNLLSAGAAAARARVWSRGSAIASHPIELVDFENSRGERLRGILDRTEAEGPITSVVIPPAWGRTKETLLPLALTIVETFRKAGCGVAVLRFDGTRRRGESYKEPGFSASSSEHLAFRLSHAIEDISAAAQFMTESGQLNCAKVVLITFSAASIEGRRAVLLDGGRTFAGWVSVVGTPDLQSGLRAVSGGVDYVGGFERGLAFGSQEVMGVRVDVDGIVRDAIDLRLPFLEDARRDMEAIRVPITWIHGAYDGWLELDRVREILGCGQREGRRLIEVPTGHQLRSSLEALEVFQLVAAETASIATGRKVAGVLPDLRLLEERRTAERARVPKVSLQLRDFWRSYLIGQDGHLGIELMNASSAYRTLMNVQIDALRLVDGDRIADVGSGTGSFPLGLVERGYELRGISIDEIDFVEEALERARARLGIATCMRMGVTFECCNLEDHRDRQRIFTPKRYSAALLSLLLGYVSDPAGLLRDLRPAIRPGGRVVASTMRKDTDPSRVFFEGVDELRAGRAREVFGEASERTLEASTRQFLNEAARILDLEEAGVFRFLDSDEMASMLEDAGFEVVDCLRSFGDPPQAIVLVARARD